MKKFNTIIVLVIFCYLLITGILFTIGGVTETLSEREMMPINRVIFAIIWLIGTVSLAGAGVIRAIQNSNSLSPSEADDRPLISDETKEKAMTQVAEARVLRMFLIGIGLFVFLLYLHFKINIQQG